MHVPPRHLFRRTWLIRHVGRCREAGGGGFSRNRFLQGSGEQENLWNFNQKSENNKDARTFNSFNLKGQSAAVIASPLRSTDGSVGEAALIAGYEVEGGNGFETVEVNGGVYGDGFQPDGYEAVFEDASVECRLAECDGAKRRVETLLENSELAGCEIGEAGFENAEDVHGLLVRGGMVVVDKEALESAWNEPDVEEKGVGTVGNVHGEKRSANSCNPSMSCHLHAHCFSPSPSSVSSSCVGSCVGVGGSPGWAVGRWSARLSSRWCCPGCGLYGDGTLCMNCDMHGVGNSCTDPELNLRLVRSHRHRGGTKTLRASSGIKVGCRFLENPSGDASLADYLRSAPTSWPVEAWECRTIVYPRVVKEVCFLAGGCEVVSARLPQSERYPVSPGPGELLRSGLGWTPLLRSPSSGVWLFRGAVRGGQLLAAPVSTVDWVVRGSYRTARAVGPRCLCSYAYGRGVAVWPQTGARSWELLQDLWKAIAPQTGTLVCRWGCADVCESELLRWLGVVRPLAQR